MEIRLLRYFLAIVQEGNLSKAAETLHVTQPTLSRQMMQLEEELGVTLFNRSKIIELTDAGVLLKRRAEDVVSMMDKIESEFSATHEISGTISIGSGGLNSSRVLPEIMESFRRLNPNVQFQIYTNSADYIKEHLEQG